MDEQAAPSLSRIALRHLVEDLAEYEAVLSADPPTVADVDTILEGLKKEMACIGRLQEAVQSLARYTFLDGLMVLIQSFPERSLEELLKLAHRELRPRSGDQVALPDFSDVRSLLDGLSEDERRKRESISRELVGTLQEVMDAVDRDTCYLNDAFAATAKRFRAIHEPSSKTRDALLRKVGKRIKRPPSWPGKLTSLAAAANRVADPNDAMWDIGLDDDGPRTPAQGGDWLSSSGQLNEPATRVLIQSFIEDERRACPEEQFLVVKVIQLAPPLTWKEVAFHFLKAMDSATAKEKQEWRAAFGGDAQGRCIGCNRFFDRSKYNPGLHRCTKCSAKDRQRRARERRVDLTVTPR
jgi:hypothetical protein